MAKCCLPRGARPQARRRPSSSPPIARTSMPMEKISPCFVLRCWTKRAEVCPPRTTRSASRSPALAPPPEHRVFPDPRDLTAVPQLIAARGGVDACYGGIGITGHIAFNEPPAPDAPMSAEAFAALPTRVLTLTCETRTINSVTVGGELSIIPHRAVTVGMKEILGARRLRLYCNRPWQSSVVRRVLHGPLIAACPASLMRTHPDATLTVTDYVAKPPDIQLR